MSKASMVDEAEEDQPAELVDADEPDGIEALRAEAAALKEQALRYAAEAENTRRRAEREVNDARAYAIQKFARDLLGVADNLERALQHAAKDSDDPLAAGLELTRKDLLSAFERNGLKKIEPAPGERFDPHRHQAMMEQSSAEMAPGEVIQVLQSGYELFGRNVRPAMVVVAARDSTGKDAKSRSDPSAEAETANEGQESPARSEA